MAPSATALEDRPFAARIRKSQQSSSSSPGAKRAAFRTNPNGVLDEADTGCRIERDARGVCKSGSRVRIEEARALKYAHTLSLPVPMVHEVTSSAGQTSILMDFVDGECLEEAWPSMTVEQKRSIAEQLRAIVSTMREAQPNQTTIGSFDGPARDCRQFGDYLGGPFEKEADFNKFVLDFLGRTPELIQSTISSALAENEHRTVLAHGDLSPRNIIIKDGRIQGLLDWEFSGWYPEYWEYVKFFDRHTDCKDWKDYAGIIFETIYSKELLTFQALARWQRP